MSVFDSFFLSVFSAFFQFFFFCGTCTGTLNELKEKDMSNDNDVAMSQKTRVIIDDDDIPLARKLKIMKNEYNDDDDDDVPLSQKAKVIISFLDLLFLFLLSNEVFSYYHTIIC